MNCEHRRVGQRRYALVVHRLDATGELVEEPPVHVHATCTGAAGRVVNLARIPRNNTLAIMKRVKVLLDVRELVVRHVRVHLD